MDQIILKYYFKGAYVNKSVLGSRENKANCERGMLDFIHNTEDYHGPSDLAMTFAFCSFVP
jgi:hypothetical protein